MTDTYSIGIKVDSSDVNKATSDLNKMAGATSNAESALKSIIGVAKGLIALETLRRTADYAIEAADSFTLMSSKLKLATSSQEEFNKAQKSLFDISQANSTELASTIDLYARLSRGMKDAGNSQADILKMTNAVGQALKISGATTAESSSVITQFGQALGSGVLRGEEFNAIMENGNRLARALADGLGVPLSSLRQLAAQGQLTGDIVTKAILSQTDALDKEASVMQTTVSQSWTQLQNAITQYIGEADQANGTSKELANTIVELAKNFKDLADPIATAISYVAKVEVGGWIALSDAIKTAKIALQEMVGIQQAGTADPEVLKLMKMGQGQMSIDEIAGKKAQETEKTVAKAAAATNVHLGNVSKAAKKTANDAEKAFQETISATVKAAENAATLQDAIGETAKKRLELELDAAKEKARLDSKEARSYEDKLKIAEELQKKQEEIITSETNLREQALSRQEEILNARIAGVQQEIDAANQFNLTQSERIRLETELASLQTQKQVIPEQRTQIELDAIKQLSSATKDLNELRTTGEESVRDEALRTLAVMESNLDFAKEMATGFADAFGEMGNAIGGVIVSLAEYEKQMATIKVQMDEDIAKNPSKRYEIEQKAAEKSAKAQINAYGDMAASAQKFFKKGTTGYEAMGAAVKVFRAFEMAQSAMSMINQIGDMGKILAEFIGMETTKTAEKVANNATQQASDATGAVTSATKAVADAGQGDPYTGIIRAAAMLAFMAAIGIAVGGGGGGSSTPAAKPPEPGTGTVKGDPTAVSESISKSLDILEKNSSNDLNYSADMLDALYKIRDALTGVQNLIASSLTPAISNLMLKFGDGVKQAGFIFNDQKLSKILASGKVEGMIGARIETQSSQMMVTIKKGQTMVTEYSNKFAEAFGSVVLTIKNSIAEVGKVIGVTDEQITQRLANFKVKLGVIDIAGLSAEEAAKKIEAAFSAMSDTMAMQALPEFKQFQQSGEGYKETIVRVAEGINRATGNLDLLGMEAIKYTDITKKNKDVAAEITRQTILAQGNLGEGAKKYVTQLTGSSEDIIDAYKKLSNIQNSLKTIGANANDLSRIMINAAGGLSAFQDAISSFIDNFMTPADKIKGNGQALADQFGRLGVTMPKTRDGFRDLILSLDTTTEAGQKTYGQLIALSPAFNDYISGVEDLQSSMADLMSSIKDMKDSIMSDIADLTSSAASADLISGNVTKAWEAVNEYIAKAGDGLNSNIEDELKLIGDLKSAIMANYNSQLSIIKDQAKQQADAIKAASQVRIDSIKAEAQASADSVKKAADEQIASLKAASDSQISAIKDNLDVELEGRKKQHEAALSALQGELDAANKLKSAVDQVKAYAGGLSLGSSSPLSPTGMFNASQRQYQDLLRRAQGGDAEAISQLSGAADQYLQQARKYYGSGTQYANIFDGVKQAMETIGAMDVTDPNSIQSRIDLLREQQAAELKALQDAAQSQIDQIDSSTKNQIDSINQASSAQIQSIKDESQNQITALQNETQSQIDALTDPEKNLAIKALKESTIIELKNVYKLAEDAQKKADLQNDKINNLAQLQYDETKNHTTILQDIANILGIKSEIPITNPSNDVASPYPTNQINQPDSPAVSEIANETRASVNVQKEGFSQMIQQLTSIDARLSTMERNQRLSA